MKKLYLILAIVLTTGLFAQSPQKMSYQAVIRNASNTLLSNTIVGMKISILQGSVNGTVVYAETQIPNTNANGLVSIEIGNGTVVSGGFANINWANGPFFIKTETDPTGLTNYSIVGTSQLLSVPFALHAKTAESITGTITETDPVYSASQAANITASHLTKLSTLSGINTGDETASTIKSKLGITTLSGSNTGDQDGSETKITAGSKVTVIGAGTISNPYIISATGQTSGTASGQMQYWNGTAWVTVAPGTTGQVLTFCNGIPTWEPCSGTVPFVTNPTTGKIWMDRNLGATQVATSSTDAASYGDLYQWGRGTDGHQIRTSATTSTLSNTDVPGHGNFIVSPNSPNDWRSPQNINLWQGVNGINNPCPASYRIPTDAELNAERLSWSTNNNAGAYASPLKLPAAGYRDTSPGVLIYVGTRGFYWSSTISTIYSNNLYFASNEAYMYSNFRALGHSVRCIKD
jgi:uncharacterized protein (TIGR02145 family)